MTEEEEAEIDLLSGYDDDQLERIGVDLSSIADKSYYKRESGWGEIIGEFTRNLDEGSFRQQFLGDFVPPNTSEAIEDLRSVYGIEFTDAMMRRFIDE